MGVKESKNVNQPKKEKEPGILLIILLNQKYKEIISNFYLLQVKEVLERYLIYNVYQVWKVFSKKYKKPFALKEMAKAKIVDKKSEKSIKYERDLLSQIKHPYL